MIVGIPAEVFFETGSPRIRERSGYTDAFVLGYTNGVVGYLPRAEDYPEGGWKVDATYALPDLHAPRRGSSRWRSIPTPGSGPIEFALSLVNRLGAPSSGGDGPRISDCL